MLLDESVGLGVVSRLIQNNRSLRDAMFSSNALRKEAINRILREDYPAPREGKTNFVEVLQFDLA